MAWLGFGWDTVSAGTTSFVRYGGILPAMERVHSRSGGGGCGVETVGFSGTDPEPDPAGTPLAGTEPFCLGA